MNVSRDLESRVSAWLDATATDAGSDEVLAAAIDQASLVRQLPTRRSWPNLRGFARPTVAAAALAVAVMVVAVTAIPPMPKAASARVTGVWPSGADVAFTAELQDYAPDGIYWRAAAYDTWSGSDRGWRASDETTASVDAGASILDVAGEPVASDGRTEISATIVSNQRSEVVVAPGIPVTIDQATTVDTAGPGGPLVDVSLSRPSDPYRVSAMVAPTPEGPTSVTPSRSQAAGTDYPDAIRSRYAQAPDPGELGHASMDFLAAIRASAGDDPYQIAHDIVGAFQRPAFTYDVDTRNVDCGDDGFTECFLRVKRGYCMYFSTAMIMLLRYEGIPARIVMGFLPGERVGSHVTVRKDDAHAWVEVYFPEWGWITFDPTPRPAPRQAP
jgi:transglutaminase-like putative cysteine protease